MYPADLEILHGWVWIVESTPHQWIAKSVLLEIPDTWPLPHIQTLPSNSYPLSPFFLNFCLRNYEISFKEPQPFHNIILCDICVNTLARKNVIAGYLPSTFKSDL